MGRPGAPGPRRDVQRHPGKVAAGSLTKEAANLEKSADISMSAQDAVARTVFHAVSVRERAELAKLSQRGVTPVRVQRMLPYLREYPDKKAAAFLESGFREGFPIPCFRRHLMLLLVICPRFGCAQRWCLTSCARKCPWDVWRAHFLFFPFPV